ncbi:MAG: hypothetical protein JO089_02130 [Alphaproteobacteria bacterium]|nr:hypothetical protein [Alphaproteobacteria bacterium]
MTRVGRLLTRHWLIALPVMGISALVLGLCSYNLFFLLRANFLLIRDYGVMALLEGALQQLAELILYGLASLAAYILFKACEKVLVERVLKGH